MDLRQSETAWLQVRRASRTLVKSCSLARRPEPKSPEHVGMGKKSITLIAQNGAIHSAAHVTPRCNFRCGYADLIAVAIRVFDCGSINDAIKAGPQCRAHAHGTRLAGGVEGIPPERDL